VKPDPNLVREIPKRFASHVRRHDDDGSREVQHLVISEREHALFQNPEECVPEGGVGLLDLVEEDDRVVTFGLALEELVDQEVADV